LTAFKSEKYDLAAAEAATGFLDDSANLILIIIRLML
jgi:hypothetical protein